MQSKWWLVLIILALTGVVIAAAIAAKPSYRISVTFLGYTQDLHGFRRSQYRVPSESAESMGVFRLEKRGPHEYGYVVKTLEQKQAGRWIRDTNTVGVLGAGLLSDDPRLVPFTSNVVHVAVPRPSGAPTWRCRVELTELPRRGSFKARARNLLCRLGLHDPADFTCFELVSAEISR